MRRGLRRSRRPAGPGSPLEEPGGPDDTRPLPAAGTGAPGDAEASGDAEPGDAAEAGYTADADPDTDKVVVVVRETPGVSDAAGGDDAGEPADGEEPADAGEAGAEPVPAGPGRPRHAWALTERLSALPLVRLPRRAAARVGSTRVVRLARTVAVRAPAPGFSRLTLVPALLVVAWLLPAVPLLLAGSFALAPMLVISIPLALVLIVIGLRQVPARWPASAQAKTGPGDGAPWWSLLATIAIAAGFAAWQLAESSQQLIGVRDQSVSLQFGYWIAQHGSASIPVMSSAFGGAHAGLGFASTGFALHGTSLAPQFLAGLPSLLAAGFWAAGLNGALLVPPVLGALAVLSFAGLTGRLAGPRWAPAGAIMLALALPEQYTSRSPFAEPLVQILVFGGLCLFIDALGTPVRRRGGRARWWRTGPGPATVLAALGGLALGLGVTVQLDALVAVLAAIPVIGVMFAARKPQWLPFLVGLAVGTGYGLADGYALARPYLDLQSFSLRAFGIIAGLLTVLTLAGVLLARRASIPPWLRSAVRLPPLRWFRWAGRLAAAAWRGLPTLAAVVTVLALVGFAIRPYVQTVRANSSPAVIGYVGYLQRAAGLPLDPRRLYAEDTLYWVIWYIGLPALLLGVVGLALLARRVARALLTWSDPDGSARLWALPLLITGAAALTVLWRPDTLPDQPWASRRLVPLVLPGLILAAVWAAAWLTSRAGLRGAGKTASTAVAALSLVALLLPTALTTFGVGVSSTGGAQPAPSATGLAFQRTGSGELAAVGRLCTAIGPGASVLIVDARIADSLAQLIRGECNTPTARLVRPSPFTAQAVVSGIARARRRAVVLGATQAQLGGYGGFPREILSLTTTQDPHNLSRPPSTTWPVKYTVWMAQPGGA